MTELNNARHLLEQIEIIKTFYDEQKQLNGGNFNLFKAARLESDELVHSRIIAELLNPKGSHGQEELFLKLFIQQIGVVKPFNYKNASVKLEFASSKILDGRIDILIIDNEHNKILIENKIWAGDQANQLYRYYEFAKGKLAHPIIYLTPYGKEPSEGSKGDLLKDENYVCVSYSEDILNWLKTCRKECFDKRFIKKAIEQYETVLINLLNMNKELENKVCDLISRHPAEALLIAHNWIHFRWRTEYKFWAKLEEIVKAHNFKLCDFEKYKFSENNLKSVLYLQKNRNPWFGVLVHIQTLLIENVVYDVCLLLERSQERIYYGIRLFQNKKSVRVDNATFADLKKTLLNKLETDIDNGVNGVWICRRYTELDINFENFSSQDTLQLSNDKSLGEAIDKIWHELNVMIMKTKEVLE